MNFNNGLRLEPICPRSGSFVHFPGFSSLLRTQSLTCRTVFFASKSDFAACSPHPSAKSATPFWLPSLSRVSVSNGSIRNEPYAHNPRSRPPRRPQLRTHNAQPRTPNAARTGPLYQYDLQKPQTSCINLLRSNNHRPITEHPNPKLGKPKPVTLLPFSVFTPLARPASRCRNAPDFSRPDPPPL